MRKATRRTFLATAGGILAPALLSHRAVAAKKPRRNVLFIFSDQQQKFALGCMGNRDIHTPTLDRLASDGVLFQSCYSANPVCGPYRCSLLTGRHASTTGLWSNGQPLPTDGRNLAEILERNQVHTSWVGKWHIGGRGNRPIPAQFRGGFTDFIGYQSYNAYYRDVCFYDEAGLEHRFERHREEVATDLAIERLKRAAGGSKPFVMFVSYQAPHYPEQPAPEYAELYASKPMKKRPNYQSTDPYIATFDPPSPKPKEKDPDYQRYGNNMDEYMRLYNALCTQVDAGVRRILATLDAMGIADETLVLYSSDHGDMQGSHGLTNKNVPYEEAAGIPFIVRLPGGTPGRTCAAPVSSVDVYPTVLDWLGIKPDAPDYLEGRSLLPYIAGKKDLSEIPVYSECVLEDNTRWHMVRRGEFKLVLRHQEGQPHEPWLLFDLQRDPYEMTNLMNSAKHAALGKELGELLTRFK